MIRLEKNKIYILAILIFAMMSISSGRALMNTIETENINPSISMREENWIEDISYLQRVLPQKHVNLFYKMDPKDFDTAVNNLKNSLLKLDDNEIKLGLSQIVASAKDGHTSISLALEETKCYPVLLRWFDKDLRVIGIDKEHQAALGKKLLSINGIPVNEVVDKINTLISYENTQWANVINVRYMTIPSILKGLDIVQEDAATYVFIDDEGSIISMQITPEEIFDHKNMVRTIDLMPSKPISLQFYNTDPYYFNLYYTNWYEYLPGERILYFQYNSCSDNSNEKVVDGKSSKVYSDFNKLSEELLLDIEKNEIDKFIIDLRFNMGGNSSLMTRFVSRLKYIDKLDKRGKIFVVVGKHTFSGGVFACISLKKYTKALFFGEASGNNVNMYAEQRYFTLPNSKVKVQYSTEYYELSNDYKENFIPDYAIEQTFDNYIKGIDDVYEAIKKYQE